MRPDDSNTPPAGAAAPNQTPPRPRQSALALLARALELDAGGEAGRDRAAVERRPTP